MWLDADQQRAWLAYIRLQLRLTYEINRQLQTDSGLSMADYDVFAALSVAPGHRLTVSDLATHIGWERSRASHHVKRMVSRGLLQSGPSPDDRRTTTVTLTDAGRTAHEDAAPGHVDLVRQLFFDGLPPELLTPLTSALEQIYAHVLTHGSLPPPGSRR